LDNRIRADEAERSNRFLLLDAARTPGGSRRELQSADPDALFEEARTGRVIPLLAAAIRSGGLIVPADLTGPIADADRKVQEESLSIERGANSAIRTLTEAGTEPIVLKGLATAHLDYPHAHLRQIGDVDLLVPHGDLDVAQQSLTAAGYCFQERAGHGVATKSITLRSPDGIEIDLHRLPTWLPYGGWVLDTPVRFETVTVSAVPWRVLPRPDRFVLAVAHYVLSVGPSRRLSSAADALILWPQQSQLEDWTEAIERWRAPVLVAAFRSMMHDLGLGLPEIPGCSADRARWYQRSLLAAGAPDNLSPRLGELATVPAGEALRLLTRAVFPSRADLQGSPHASRARRLAYLLRLTLRSLLPQRVRRAR
jgi:hypothetical protein